MDLKSLQFYIQDTTQGNTWIIRTWLQRYFAYIIVLCCNWNQNFVVKKVKIHVFNGRTDFLVTIIELLRFLNHTLLILESWKCVTAINLNRRCLWNQPSTHFKSNAYHIANINKIILLYKEVNCFVWRTQNVIKKLTIKIPLQNSNMFTTL